MKTCKRCLRELPYSEFYVHKAMGDGYLSFCKECTKKRVVEHRERNLDKIQEYDRGRGNLQHRIDARKEYAKTECGKEAFKRAHKRYKERYPDRREAHNKVAYAISSGKMTRPSECQECGSTKRVEAHHEDYSKPLDVEFLCRKCHTLRHKKHYETPQGEQMELF